LEAFLSSVSSSCPTIESVRKEHVTLESKYFFTVAWIKNLDVEFSSGNIGDTGLPVNVFVEWVSGWLFVNVGETLWNSVWW